MKSVAFYFESSEATGGVNRVASNIASVLAERGYKVHIISRYEGRSGRFTDDSRITFHQLFKKFHSKYITSFVEAVKLRRLVKREKIDVLISAGGIFYALAQFSDVKHIEWDHVSFWHGNKLQKYFRRLSARNASAVVTLTQDNREAFSAIRGAKAEILTINNPAFFKQEKIIDPANKVIVSLGFLAQQKGYDLLMEAWNMIDKELRSQWRLKIAGDDRGGKSIIDKIIEEHDLTEVELLGFSNDVSPLLSESSIYVMPSRWEGMPMVLLEAQSFGLPVVSFDCKTGPSEILTPECGVLVEAGNVENFASALEKVMRDEELRRHLSNGALENIKRFSLEKITREWIDLIERV